MTYWVEISKKKRYISFFLVKTLKGLYFLLFRYWYNNEKLNCNFSTICLNTHEMMKCSLNTWGGVERGGVWTFLFYNFFTLTFKHLKLLIRVNSVYSWIMGNICYLVVKWTKLIYFMQYIQVKKKTKISMDMFF